MNDPNTVLGTRAIVRKSFAEPRSLFAGFQSFALRTALSTITLFSHLDNLIHVHMTAQHNR